ncbi:MAG: ZIP family metal transporter [Armatimonadetes bacterium]|nr:ZIP family metal transporter [Armatimonadota bacterium]
MTLWLYTLGSTLLISLLALVGILALYLRGERLNAVLLPLVGFAAGGLLGNAFLELIPEVVRERGTLDSVSSLLVLSGIVLFFLMEQVVRHWQAKRGWTHDHASHVAHLGLRPSEETAPGGVESVLQARPFAVINLGGDLAHNFIDGLAVGAAFIAGADVGFATVVAVILHEIPQELGDFAVLVQAGLTRRRALLYNFLTALTAVAGGVVALLLREASQTIPHYLIPFAAGTFIYLAIGDLIPELHAHGRAGQTVPGVLGLLTGIALMYLLHVLH